MRPIGRRWILTGLWLCGTSVPALAQVATPSPTTDVAETSAPPVEAGLAEIVVTAQRRSENLQRAALSVTAISGATLEQRGITNPQQLTLLAPALQATPNAGPYVTYTMRGVTSASANAYGDPALALNFNQVYLATPTASFGLFYDLERVEVLKGPQGTLYGRNATGGAINIIPRRPQLGTVSADLSLDVGNYKAVTGRAAVNAPLGENFALRAAGQVVSRQGYFSDGTGDEGGQSGRVSLLFKPGADFSLVLVGDVAFSDDRGGGATIRKTCATGVCYVDQPYTGLQDLPQAFAPLAPASRDTFNTSRYYGVSAVGELVTNLGTLTAVSGYRKSRIRLVSTQSGFYYRTFDNPDQFSLEARLASSDQHAIRWLVGGYYLTNSNDSLNNSESAAGRSTSASFFKLSGHSLAAFGQLTAALTPTLRLTGGGRYTSEKKNANVLRYTLANVVGPVFVLPSTPPTNLTPTVSYIDAKSFSAFTWRGGVEWDAGPRSLLYANVSTGFKAGGFFTGPIGANTYRPEHVTAYAIGSKNRFFGNRLQLNVEAFLQDYKDQQITYNKIVQGSAISVTENVGRARMKGVDLEMVALVTPTTQLSVQGQYLDSRYRSLTYSTVSPPPATSKCTRTVVGAATLVDCTGQSPVRSPKFVLSGSVEQTLRLSSGHDLVAAVYGRHESSKELDIAYIPETFVKSGDRFDLTLTYYDRAARLSIGAFVNNVANIAQPAYAIVSPGYSVNRVVAVTLLAPRTYGVRMSAGF